AVTGGELIKHGQDGRNTDARGDEQDWPGAGLEYEFTAGRRDIQNVARLEFVVQVVAGHAVRLALDADPVGAAVGRGGQRVAAHRGRLACTGDPHRQVLAGPDCRELASVRGGQVDRGDGCALSFYLGHAQRAETGPGRLAAC